MSIVTMQANMTVFGEKGLRLDYLRSHAYNPTRQSLWVLSTAFRAYLINEVAKASQIKIQVRYMQYLF